jgi:hypothetical protein
MKWTRWQEKGTAPKPVAEYPWVRVAWDWAADQGFDEIIGKVRGQIAGYGGYGCSRDGIRTEVRYGSNWLRIEERTYVDPPTRLGGVIVVDRDFVRRETDPTSRRLWRVMLASGWSALAPSALGRSIDRYNAYVEKERIGRPLPLASDFLSTCAELNVVKFQFYRDCVTLEVEAGESPQTQIVGATDLVRKATSLWRSLR